ncbi:unnamed protein product [Gulo gulo]|uniref:Uncharacterized protein n=1 Tax=Gulo gulo TaxID=48420 RepID=A0A9X9LSZ2_GULGU|nr:unnamed protein product [Gulo gulo]
MGQDSGLIFIIAGMHMEGMGKRTKKQEMIQVLRRIWRKQEGWRGGRPRGHRVPFPHQVASLGRYEHCHLGLSSQLHLLAWLLGAPISPDSASSQIASPTASPQSQSPMSEASSLSDLFLAPTSLHHPKPGPYLLTPKLQQELIPINALPTPIPPPCNPRLVQA